MNAHPSIRIEGGLFGPDLFEALTRGDLPGQKPADFGLPPRRSLNDEIAAAFHDARAQWDIFQRRLERLPQDETGTSETREFWVIPLLRLLGYDLRFTPRAREVDGMRFAISHRAGESETAPPVHIVSARQDLGRVARSGRPRLSPHALVQEYLNRTDEALWGLVTNGRTLRLLRDSTFIRRQAYVEFDLQAMVEEDRFADFALLYRLLHRTRLPADGAPPQDCLLETCYQRGLEQGGRVREHLRDGVEQAIRILANGFLGHEKNAALRDWVAQEGALAFYRALLRLVYRFLFLLVSEERGLMGRNPLYLEHYGVTRLRRLTERRAAWTDDVDLWHSLRALWMAFTDEKMAALLGVPPLNGDLFARLTLDDAVLANRDLLQAIWHLTWYQEDRSAPPRRVNYAALDTEELGSVYESLLDYHPAVVFTGRRPRFDLAPGSERKSTGSYYTPPPLVNELVRSALEPVIAERLKGAADPEQALLSIKVCDPACGSGHFLLAAARRLGMELARVRTGEDQPAPERVREAVRDVVAHCIYGVDKNPLAVELTRVALWLESHAAGKPLTFLEHRIKHGDSLVGVFDLEALKEGLPDGAFKPLHGEDRARARQAKRSNEKERTATLFQHAFARQALERFSASLQQLDAMPNATLDDVRAKERAWQALQGSPEWQRLHLAADAWTAAFFQPFRAGDAAAPITTAVVQEALSTGRIADARVAGRVLELRQTSDFFHWPLEFAEVFQTGGFDVVLGNPPFMGGKRISSSFGAKYRHWLDVEFSPFINTADLCAAFFRRAFDLLRPGGRLGMIATNTLGQGDTRQSGLAVILKQGGTIPFARRFVKWPGQATVEVNLVVVARSPALPLPQAPVLDDQPVPFISSRLDDQPEREPVALPQNENKAFQGDIVRGMGFVLEPWEAEQLLARDPRNADCLFPYLNGADLNHHPEQQPSRWVICFHDWPLERARQYPDLLRIVEERVKPGREALQGSGDKHSRTNWWRFHNYRMELRQSVFPLTKILVRSRVSELHAVVFAPKGYVYSDATIVFAFDDDYHFALLQSTFHETWLRKQASSLRTDIRYTPTDCFATFPFPPAEYAAPDLSSLLAQPPFARAAQVGAAYHEHRRQVMLARQLGLTKTYNLFHDPACQDEDIVRLRELHVEMDNAILACYGWENLELRHDFYPNERGKTRFMPSEAARREIIVRLVELNAEMAREEQEDLPLKPPPETAPATSSSPAKPSAPVSDYGLYRCQACGQRVLGFDRENHLREAHGGQRAEFEKIR